MATSHVTHEGQGTDANRTHVITDLDENALTLETTDRDLVGFYYNNTGGIGYLKFWNILENTPSTEQVGPDLVWPCGNALEEPVWFETISSTDVRSPGIQNVFTTGMTVIFTAAKDSGNAGGAITQTAPTTNAPPTLTIITKKGD